MTNPTAWARGAGRGGRHRHHHSDGGSGTGTGAAIAALHYERHEWSSSSGVDTASERTDSVYSTSPRQEAYFDRWNRKQLRDSDLHSASSSSRGGLSLSLHGKNNRGNNRGRRSRLLSGASEAARVLFSRRGRSSSERRRRPDPAEAEAEESSGNAAARRAAERFIEEENAAAVVAEHELAVGRWEAGATCVRVVAHEGDDGADDADVGCFGPDRGDDDDVTMAARKESLRLQRRFLGGNDADVALTLNNIGNAYYGRGEVAEAMEAYEEALRVSSSSSVGVLPPPRDY